MGNQSRGRGRDGGSTRRRRSVAEEGRRSKEEGEGLQFIVRRKEEEEEKEKTEEGEGRRRRQKCQQEEAAHGWKEERKEDTRGPILRDRLGSMPKKQEEADQESEEIVEEDFNHIVVKWIDKQQLGGQHGGGNMEVLQDRSKVHRVATLAPGLLASSSIEQMKTHLVQVAGTGWEADSQGLPPLLSLYNRTYMMPRLSGGVAREFSTLAFVGDLLLQARPAEALDGIIQRLKSIEMTSSGSPWSTSQKLELAPSAEASLGSRQEYQLAQKEAKMDQAVKGSTSGGEKGKSQGKSRGKGKDKDRGKGKSKEGDAKKGS